VNFVFIWCIVYTVTDLTESINTTVTESNCK